MLKENKLLILIFLSLLVTDIFLISIRRNKTYPEPKPKNNWELQGVDTVKYSRDIARQYMNDESFNVTIDKQTKFIASTGATHISLGTPYDKEFIPYLKRWVMSARTHGLKVWFRGNFSGWEGWFDYDSINREEHKKLLEEFILSNGNLFEDGDIFTSCTECENGGPGDPRSTGDISGHRQFLIDEYQISRKAFAQVSRNVKSNYYPMNYDVALLVMDKETTKSLGGIVTIDHYVSTPEILIKTIDALIESSGGRIVLGEFGAPIPDIHGEMTDQQQAEWVNKALTDLSANKNVIGVNYWTSWGGSTRLWTDTDLETPTVDVIKSFFKPQVVGGRIINEGGREIGGATIKLNGKEATTNSTGIFEISYSKPNPGTKVAVSAEGYETVELDLPNNTHFMNIELIKKNSGLLYKTEKLLYKTLGI
jgi:hypothetical protein